jgi:hypothetical protein
MEYTSIRVSRYIGLYIYIFCVSWGMFYFCFWRIIPYNRHGPYVMIVRMVWAGSGAESALGPTPYDVRRAALTCPSTVHPSPVACLKYSPFSIYIKFFFCQPWYLTSCLRSFKFVYTRIYLASFAPRDPHLPEIGLYWPVDSIPDSHILFRLIPDQFHYYPLCIYSCKWSHAFRLSG